MDRLAPLFYISVFPEGAQGERLDQSHRIISLEYEDSETMMDKLSITVNNLDLSNFDSFLWRKGNVIQVQYGYAGYMSPARQAIITAVTGFQVLKVEALGQGISLHTTQRADTFENMTRAEVVRKVAERNGITQLDVEDTGEKFDAIHQANMTDGEFMSHLAQKQGFEFYQDGDGLHFHQRRTGQAPIRGVHWYGGGEGDLLDVSIENDVTAYMGAVTATGRDPLEKKTITQTASNSTTKRTTLASTVEVVDPEYGTTHYATRRSGSRTVPTAQPTESSAKALADGHYTKGQQGMVSMKLKLLGDPGLVAKAVVVVGGIGARLSGRYYVKAAKHTINGSGYITTLTCITDGLNGGGGAPSGGTPNTKEPKKDKAALTPVEVVDGETGRTKYQWRDTQGRHFNSDKGGKS